eukprot:CAMPEP_0171121564 /NCGR_PEP_ID=MMETSP0766_2-20121228/102818_1 /TAXON_ID=439317 /ORGANISM="Gambierdiscus australes, Strain CAWD 149" /LENGTH=44 /DNA_ID= /DNA_START= /DNA_END= /DNA_ORIENTATION=
MAQYLTGDTWLRPEVLATSHYAFRIGDAHVHKLAEGRVRGPVQR